MNWTDHTSSLKRIHTPKTINDLSLNSNFRLRLAYDELLSHQLSLLIARNFSKKNKKKRRISTHRISTLIRKKLPFSLTKSQELCIAEIQSDLSKTDRMYRLIQGDVGSGKTLVALFAMILVAENRGQSALMVPTDILANQHFLILFNIQKILELALFY